MSTKLNVGLKSESKSRLPSCYYSVTWRNTKPADSEGRIGLGMETPDGGVIRVSLDAESARRIIETLTESLNPNRDVPPHTGKPSRPRGRVKVNSRT